MKTRNKAILTAVCAVLLVVLSVMGTMAYLTDTDKAVNTFTVGKVGLNLDEAKVDEYGQFLKKAEEGVDHEYDVVDTLEEADRVKANQYLLVPGHTYPKDPTVTVDAGSEACYVRMFVKVDNIEALTGPLTGVAGYWQENLFLLQKLCGGWSQENWACVGLVKDTDDIYEFRYKEAVAKSETATTLPALFTSITLPGEYFGNDDMVSVEADEEAGTEAKVGLDAVTIKVYAQAMQADGFKEDEEGAWTAAGMPQFN